MMNHEYMSRRARVLIPQRTLLLLYYSQAYSLVIQMSIYVIQRVDLRKAFGFGEGHVGVERLHCKEVLP